MRYFLTGSTGFVGSYLARALADRDDEVVALVRDLELAVPLRELGVTLVRGDITGRGSIAAAAGADGVFHVTGWYRVGARDKTEAIRVNVEGTRNVLETMRDLAIPKGVYTSSLAIHSDTHGFAVDESHVHAGPFLSLYDETKLRAHHEVALPLIRDGLPLVIVDPGVVHGPGDVGPTGRVIERYLLGRLHTIPARTAYCWTHVEDVVEGHRLAMEEGRIGESYITAGAGQTLVDIVGISERIAGIPTPRMVLPPWVLRPAAAATAVVERIVPLPEDASAEYLRVAADVTYLDNSRKAQRELGFEARPIVEGLRETLIYEMQRLGVQPRRGKYG